MARFLANFAGFPESEYVKSVGEEMVVCAWTFYIDGDYIHFTDSAGGKIMSIKPTLDALVVIRKLSPDEHPEIKDTSK